MGHNMFPNLANNAAGPLSTPGTCTPAWTTDLAWGCHVGQSHITQLFADQKRECHLVLNHSQASFLTSGIPPKKEIGETATGVTSKKLNWECH